MHVEECAQTIWYLYDVNSVVCRRTIERIFMVQKKIISKKAIEIIENKTSKIAYIRIYSSAVNIK